MLVGAQRLQHPHPPPRDRWGVEVESTADVTAIADATAAATAKHSSEEGCPRDMEVVDAVPLGEETYVFV